MRDQAVLVRNAVKNEIPAFALIGKDKFAYKLWNTIIPWQKKSVAKSFLKI